ncbi:diacylglycerol kinase family protein [Zongyangia hominis]|nr:diacylglycerol kinase family protein [Zongyangia hominis]
MSKYGFSALGRSFTAALRGFCHCVKTQRNMRIHLVAAFHVLALSGFYRFSKAEYGLLLITCALVMGCEAVNTAVEVLADGFCPRRDPTAGLAKDIAAGAVLVCAFFAAVVGVLLFWNLAAFGRMAGFFARYPWALLVPAATLTAGLVWAMGAPGNSIKKRKL